MQFNIGTVQCLHHVYPPGLASVPSSRAAHAQPFPQPLLRSSERIGVPVRATSHVFTWVSQTAGGTGVLRAAITFGPRQTEAC